MCGNIFCSFHEQLLPTRLQGAPPFQPGCVCLFVRGEVCLQSQELGNTLWQCCSEGCCSPEGEKNRSSPLSQQQSWPLQPYPRGCCWDGCSLSPKALCEEDGFWRWYFKLPFSLQVPFGFTFSSLTRCFTLTVFSYREYQKILP